GAEVSAPFRLQNLQECPLTLFRCFGAGRRDRRHQFRAGETGNKDSWESSLDSTSGHSLDESRALSRAPYDCRHIKMQADPPPALTSTGTSTVCSGNLR